MADRDDRDYRRNARNMAVVLAAIVVTILAALVVPPLVNPVHEQFSSNSSVASPYGFSLNLSVNSTQFHQGGAVSVVAWLNSTSSQIVNVTAGDGWPLGPAGLSTRPCTTGWPLGVGAMRGYFTEYNYSLGTLIRTPVPLSSCPQPLYSPQFFLFAPYSSSTLVSIAGSPQKWDLRSGMVIGGAALPLVPGVYTAVGVDEWGDVTVAHFRVGQ